MEDDIHIVLPLACFVHASCLASVHTLCVVLENTSPCISGEQAEFRGLL